MHIPTHGPPTHPGEMLMEEFLKPLDISQVELAKMSASPTRASTSWSTANGA